MPSKYRRLSASARALSKPARWLPFAMAALGALTPAEPARALIITEIMYHAPEANEQAYEFLEIYNELPDPLDLSGYSFTNGINFEFPPGTWLDGRSFLVVCSDEASIRAKYGITNTIGSWHPTPDAPSLSNGGERIDLSNTGGKVVATVRYNDRGKWESGADGTGHSLELESPYKELDDPDSWDLSNDLGGSPGVRNPCWPSEEVQAPSVGGAVGALNNHTDVGFPCTPGAASFASGTGRYTISGSGADIWAGGDQFQFAYVKVQGNFDIRSRIVSRAWSTDRWGKGGIMARQDLTASSRYVFVHDDPDPDGARLAVRPTHGGADNAEPFVLPDGTHPAWYRLARTANTITGYYSSDGAAWTAFGSATWDGGSTLLLGLALTSHSNCGVATLVWDSLAITGTILPPDDPGPGPGGGGGTCVPRSPVRINEAYLFVNSGEDAWVELHNKGAAPADISSYYLTDDPADLRKAALPAGTTIPAGGYKAFTASQLGVALAIGAPGERRFLALVEKDPTNRVVDAYNFEPEFQGYSEARIPGDDRAFSLAADPTREAPNVVSASTSVVINEIMYHPIDGDNRKEYVELYNRGSVAVDLTGWSLSDGLGFAFPDGTVISAQGYLVVARDPALFTGPASVYNLPASRVVGPATPDAAAVFGALKDRGERVTLSDQLGRTVNTVRYHDGGEWPRWPDGLGSSMELIDANQDNRFGQSWDASDDSSKATTETFSYVARHGNRDSELTLALLDRGITLVDDLSVIGGGVTRNDTALIDAGEVWKYTKGTSQPPAPWINLGFADGGWSTGATGIGYGDNDDATVLTDMQNTYVTIFCRKTFTVADRNAINELVLSIVIDDGFYAYLNGTKVAEYNVTSPAFDAPAPSAIEPGAPVEVDISAFKSVLINGTNVLAVQVHNAGLQSSDLSFIPRLLNRTTIISGGTEQLTNGRFETGTSGWVIEGTHVKSGRTSQAPLSGSGSLKMIATGRGDNKVNRIETPTPAGAGLNSLNPDSDVQISFKARWVVGAQTLLTNGFDHEMAKAHTLSVPLDLGTPGARNQVTQRLISQAGSANLGPVITDVKQDPSVPTAAEPVTIRARVFDPDGVSSVTLRYSLNSPAASPASISMTRILGSDVWQCTVPAQPQATRVVYYLTATDGGGRPGRYPVDVTQRTHPLLLNPPAAGLNDQRYCIYRHDVKVPATNYLNYRFYMTQADEDELSNRRLLSNDPLSGSFVFGGSTIYYESQLRFSGSPWARAGWNGSFRVRMPRDNPLHGRVRRFGLEDNQGNPIDARTRISHYLLRQNQGAIGVPFTDGFALVRWQVDDRTTGVREHNWVPDSDFISTWFPGDDEGDFVEMDDRFLIDDNGGRAGNADGRLLYPPPYGTNDSNGDNKENYRWFFGLRAKNGADEYANLIALAKVMDPARTSDAQFDQQIGDYANVEEMLRIWAVEFNIDDWDTWGTSRGKNCYLYRSDVTGLWNLIGWDFELTYGNTTSFLIPGAPSDNFDPGGFGEVNRWFHRPKLKRMYYSILDEMVNGPGRWFHSSYLDDYASRLATFGMASTSVAQPGGYIDQRASLLQSRIQAAVYPQVRLTITTNGGANFSTPSATVNLGGTAPVEVGQLLITTNSDAGTLYDPGYPGLTTWQLTDVPLIPGTANALVVYGLDLRGNIVDSDSITVTSTATWNPPAITGIDPAAAPAGADVDLRGTDFHNGLKVFFGGVQSPLVSFDENGPDPGNIVARAPPGAGAVNVTVRNADNQVSNAMSFTYVAPPPTFIRADANGDAVIDLADAVRVLLHLFSGTAVDCEDACDVDDNEQLNVTDAVTLLDYLFRAGAEPPAPYPAAGTDPSGAALGCER